MDAQERHEGYDEEPVRYCSRCYSLKIKYNEALDFEYCDDCGCTDTQESSVEEWEQLYEHRYGHKFAVKTDDPEKTFIYQLTTAQLKTRVYEDPEWRTIIRTLYPNFPSGYGKADSVILFFDRLIRDRRLNELRLYLVNHLKF